MPGIGIGIGLSALPVYAAGQFDFRTALWPTGTEPGGWWSNRGAVLGTSQSPTVTYQDSAGTTQAVAIADPVGLWLDRRLGATALANPGLHLIQATAAARPLKQARVNMLVATENFASASWGVAHSGTAADGVKTANFGTAPDGTTTACRIQLDVSAGAANNQSQVYQTITAIASGWSSSWVKTNDGTTKTIMPFSAVGTPLTVTGAWQRLAGSNVAAIQFLLVKGTTSDTADLLVWHPQAEVSATSVATTYQSITDATHYDTAGFPVFEQFDGVDDGLASATVAAGVVGNSNMYCAILMKRNSAADFAFLNAADGSKYIGYTGEPPTLASGTPTAAVDGVALAGGAAFTGASMKAALTVGAWHVVEFINLDMSAWTRLQLSALPGILFPGNIDEIVSCPNPTAAVQAKIRRSLGALVGLAL